MQYPRWIRPVLAASAVFNLGAAASLAFPERLGAWAGMRASGSLLHDALLVWLVGLFGLVYAWMARAPAIDRPLLAVAAIGKAGILPISLACWRWQAIPAAGLVPALFDAAFALAFFAWLRATRTRAGAGSV